VILLIEISYSPVIIGICMVENSITIYCKVTVFLFANAKHTTGSRYSIAVPECDVSTHFGSLLSSEEFSDVTLVVGKNELKGH